MIRLLRNTLALCIVVPALLLAQYPPPVLDQCDSNWEPEIRKFEEQDKTNPPQPGVIFLRAPRASLAGTLCSTT